MGFLESFSLRTEIYFLVHLHGFAFSFIVFGHMNIVDKILLIVEVEAELFLREGKKGMWILLRRVDGGGWDGECIFFGVSVTVDFCRLGFHLGSE